MKRNFKLQENEKELSNTPSLAIEQCLNDLEMCEQHPDYEINMSVRHSRLGKKCRVDLGGSRIARINDDINKNAYLPHGEIETNKIESMASFERLHIKDGIRFFYGIGLWEILRDKIGVDKYEMLCKLDKKYKWPIESYRLYPVEWKKRMRQMSNDLKEIGL